MRKMQLLAALTATTLMLGGTGVRADEPGKPAETKTAPTAQAGKKLTDDELIKMIEDLGYEITRLPQPGDNTKRVQIKVTRGTFDCPMSINLGGEGQSMLLSFVSLGKLDETAQSNAPGLLKLLEQNDGYLDSGRVQFRVNPTSKGLWLSRATENRGITPKLLRDHIEQTVSAAYDTQEVWNHAKWGKGDPKTETKTDPKAEPKSEQKASK